MTQASANDATREAAADTALEPIEAIKGFDADFRANGRTFEIGKTYTIDGELNEFDDGFDAVPADEHPLTVFDRFPPAGARYAIVAQAGATIREDGWTASASVTVNAESPIGSLVGRAVKWVFDRSKPEEGSHATGWQGAASATGVRGAASATGDQGAASATGDQGAALASGYEGRVRGKSGSALFLVERNNDYDIVGVWAGVVGRDGIEGDVWYTLKDGKPVKAAADED